MPEFEKVELEQKLRIANGITRKPGGRELLYDVFPTGAPFSFEALDKFSALCYTEIGILHRSSPQHFKNQEVQTMKQRFRKLLNLAGTDEFNQMFSSGDTSLIEDTADYYNDNTDGLVVVNTGGNYITAENAMVVVACGQMLYPEIAAVTFIQNAEGLWVSGLQYVLETDQINELVEGYYIGENVKAIIVFNKNCTDTQNLTLAQKKQVLRHELGHAIGLRHTFNTDYGETEPGITALMHPNCMSKYSSLTFTDYDMGELNKVYP